MAKLRRNSKLLVQGKAKPQVISDIAKDAFMSHKPTDTVVIFSYYSYCMYTDEMCMLTSDRGELRVICWVR